MLVRINSKGSRFDGMTGVITSKKYQFMVLVEGQEHDMAFRRDELIFEHGEVMAAKKEATRQQVQDSGPKRLTKRVRSGLQIIAAFLDTSLSEVEGECDKNEREDVRKALEYIKHIAYEE